MQKSWHYLAIAKCWAELYFHTPWPCDSVTGQQTLNTVPFLLWNVTLEETSALRKLEFILKLLWQSGINMFRLMLSFFVVVVTVCDGNYSSREKDAVKSQSWENRTWYWRFFNESYFVQVYTCLIRLSCIVNEIS